MMRERKDELKRKRGGLDLNSDAEEDSARVVNFRSKLHGDIKRQEREAKELHKKELAERQERNERMRSYSKNVQDLHKPGQKRASS